MTAFDILPNLFYPYMSPLGPMVFTLFFAGRRDDGDDTVKANL